eukprot:TRINITY_DN979_c2_g1_i1.p1 TRINITY_DN979_c2_g1~~TRINITY_DN979_c2_g1_i1.p1  ORF type:complete len:456 (+),score=62.88 TRINITY_DN979_c2_g1_i1:156-1523(+)
MDGGTVAREITTHAPSGEESTALPDTPSGEASSVASAYGGGALGVLSTQEALSSATLGVTRIDDHQLNPARRAQRAEQGACDSACISSTRPRGAASVHTATVGGRVVPHSARGTAISPVRSGPVRSGTSPTRGPGARNAALTRNGSQAAQSQLMQQSGPGAVKALTQQIQSLQQQLDASQAARAELEQTLADERARAAADRKKLACVTARIDQLESHSEATARMIEDNKALRSELEAHKKQLQELNCRLQIIRGGAGASALASSVTDSQEQLMEENLQLRSELQQSRELLCRYTLELSDVMPGMEALLQERRMQQQQQQQEQQRQREANDDVAADATLDGMAVGDAPNAVSGACHQEQATTNSAASSLTAPSVSASNPGRGGAGYPTKEVAAPAPASAPSRTSVAGSCRPRSQGRSTSARQPWLPGDAMRRSSAGGSGSGLLAAGGVRRGQNRGI